MEGSDYFRLQAEECRDLARATPPSAERDSLLTLARHYDREAKRAAASAEPVARPELRAV
jgi:hypothetical protein